MSFRKLLELTDKIAREELDGYYIVSESRMNNYLQCLEDGAKQIKDLEAENAELLATVKHLDGLIGDHDAEISHATDLGIKVGRYEAFLEAAEMAEAYANKHREIVARRIAATLRKRAETNQQE